MAGWNDIRQPHDPWDDEDLNPLRLASELSGMVQPPREPAAQALNAFTAATRATDSFFANADRASWEAGRGNVQYDPTLRQADVYAERGSPELLAEMLGFASEMANPFPLDFAADAAKALGAASGFAAMVPRELLEAFGKSTVRGADGLPERIFHGTPTPVSPGQLRPSKSGMLGPGFYTTIDPEEAMSYSSYPGSGYLTPAKEAASTPAIYSGYSGVPSNRVLDIWEDKRFSPEEAARVAETLQHYPGLESVVDMEGRPGVLTPYSLYQGIYDSAPAWALPEIFADLGYDAIRATDIGHTVLLNPSRDFVPTWDADRMLSVIERSQQFSPEEVDELLMLVNSFMSGR